MLKRIVVAVSLALGGAVLGSALLLAPQAAQAQDQKVEKSKPPKISAKVAKPLKAAQEAMGKNDWDTALAKTLEAKAVPELTDQDKYQIEEFLSYIYLKKQDYKNAAAAYDALLASGLLPPDQQRALRALWEEFEAGETAESRYALALDRLQPLLQNVFAQGGAWRSHGVTREQILVRMQPVGDLSADLWQYVVRLIDEVWAAGYIRSIDDMR